MYCTANVPLGGPIEGSGPPTQGGGYTALARPILSEGKLAKEAVVAVPDAYAAILCLQGIASDTAARGYRMATAAL